jgi:tetratricopeptide (TPR) repeat protein
MVGYLLGFCGASEVELGLLGQAWMHAQETIEIGERYGHGEITGLGYRVLGDIYLRLLDYEKAAVAYEKGIALGGEHLLRLENLYHYAYCLLKMDQDIGYRYLEQALDDAEKNGLGTVFLYAGIYQLQALLIKGDALVFEQKAKWFREQLFMRLGQDWAPYAIRRLQAWNACRIGDYEQTLAVANALLPWFEQSSFRWAELELLNPYVIALKQSGQDSAAPLQRIHEILDQVEAGLGEAPLKDEMKACRQKYTGQLI